MSPMLSVMLKLVAAGFWLVFVGGVVLTLWNCRRARMQRPWAVLFGQAFALGVLAVFGQLAGRPLGIWGWVLTLPAGLALGAGAGALSRVGRVAGRVRVNHSLVYFVIWASLVGLTQLATIVTGRVPVVLFGLSVLSTGLNLGLNLVVLLKYAAIPPELADRAAAPAPRPPAQRPLAPPPIAQPSVAPSVAEPRPVQALTLRGWHGDVAVDEAVFALSDGLLAVGQRGDDTHAARFAAARDALAPLAADLARHTADARKEVAEAYVLEADDLCTLAAVGEAADLAEHAGAVRAAVVGAVAKYRAKPDAETAASLARLSAAGLVEGAAEPDGVVALTDAGEELWAALGHGDLDLTLQARRGGAAARVYVQLVGKAGRVYALSDPDRAQIVVQPVDAAAAARLAPWAWAAAGC